MYFIQLILCLLNIYIKGKLKLRDTIFGLKCNLWHAHTFVYKQIYQLVWGMQLSLYHSTNGFFKKKCSGDDLV